MQERFRNQHYILDNDKIRNANIVVIGAGAIGSFFVTALSKMGAQRISVFDNDTIEEHNIANQMYPSEYIGVPKVEALKIVAQKYGDCLINAINARWHPDTAIDGDILVVAVDNMDIRKAIWDYYKDRGIKFFLEGRMSALVYRVYGVDMSDQSAKDYYDTKLYPQSEAAPERCGEKSIIYTVLQVSAQMCSQVKRFLMDQYRPTEVIYDAQNDDCVKKYHMALVPEVIEYEEPEAVAV